MACQRSGRSASGSSASTLTLSPTTPVTPWTPNFSRTFKGVRVNTPGKKKKTCICQPEFKHPFCPKRNNHKLKRHDPPPGPGPVWVTFLVVVLFTLAVYATWNSETKFVYYLILPPCYGQALVQLVPLVPGWCWQRWRPELTFWSLSDNPLFQPLYPPLSVASRWLPPGCVVEVTPGPVYHATGPVRVAAWRMHSMRKARVGAFQDSMTSMFRLLENTVHADAITSSIVERHTKLVDKYLEENPFTIDELGCELLSQAGLNVTSIPGEGHEHAAHKRIEMELLHGVLPKLIGPDDCVTVMFQKANKTRRMVSFTGRKAELFNPKITASDLTRYGSDGLTTLPRRVRGNVLFLHDVGHYLRPSDVAMMLNLYPSVERVVFTAVLPVEVETKHSGFHPHLYRVVYHSDHYEYQLGPHYRDSYNHPYSSLDWLRTGSIQGRHHETHSVELYRSIYAHRVFVVHRAQVALLDGYRSIPVPTAVVLPDDYGIGVADRIVRKELYDKVALHARHLKSGVTHDMVTSKIRMEITGDRHRFESNRAVDYLAEFTTLLHGVRAEATNPTHYSRGRLAKHLASSLNPATLTQALTLIGMVATSWLCLLMTPRGATWLFPFNLPNGPGTTQGSLGKWQVYYNVVMGPLTLASFGCLLLFRSRAHLTGRGTWLVSVFAWALAIKVVFLWLGNAVLAHFGSSAVGRDNFGEVLREAVLGSFSVLGSDTAVVWWLVVTTVTASLWYVSLTIALSSRSAAHEALNRFLDPDPLQSHHRLQCGLFSLRDCSPWVRRTTEVSPEYDSQEGAEELILDDQPVEVLDSAPPTYSSLAKAHSLECPDCPQHPSTGNQVCAAGFRLSGDAPCHICAEWARLTGRDPAVTLGEAQYEYEASDPTAVGEHVSMSQLDPLLPDYLSIRLRTVGDVSHNLVPTTCGVTALAEALGESETEVKAVIATLPDTMFSSPITQHQLDTRVLLYVAWRYRRALRVDVRGSVHVYGEEDSDDLRIVHTGNHFESVVERVLARPSRASRLMERIESYLKAKDIPGKRTRSHPDVARFSGKDLLPSTRNFVTSYKSFLAKNKLKAPRLMWKSYVPNPSRAKKLSRDMKNNATGKLYEMQGRTESIPRNFCRRVDALVDKHVISENRRRPDVALIYGMPGCGKSYCLQKWIARSSGSFKVACPTTALRDEWARHIVDPNSKWRVGTYETSLTKMARTLIVDEVSQMPPGYVDLALIMDPTIDTVVILGDHCQGTRFEPNPDASTNRLVAEVDYFLPMLSEYHMYTNRLFKRLANLLGVYTSNPEEGFIRKVPIPPEGVPVVAAKRADVNLLAETGVNAFTANTVQGQSFDVPVAVMLDDSMASRVGDGSCNAALTRSKKGLYLCAVSRHTSRRAAHRLLWRCVLDQVPTTYLSIFEDKFAGLSVQIVRRPYAEWSPTNRLDCDHALLPPSTPQPEPDLNPSGLDSPVAAPPLPRPPPVFPTPFVVPSEEPSGTVEAEALPLGVSSVTSPNGSYGTFPLGSSTAKVLPSSVAHCDDVGSPVSPPRGLDVGSRTGSPPPSPIQESGAEVRTKPVSPFPFEPDRISVELPELWEDIKARWTASDLSDEFTSLGENIAATKHEISGNPDTLPQVVLPKPHNLTQLMDMPLDSHSLQVSSKLAQKLTCYRELVIRAVADTVTSKPGRRNWHKAGRLATTLRGRAQKEFTKSLRFGARCAEDAPVDLQLGLTRVHEKNTASVKPLELAPPTRQVAVHLPPAGRNYEEELLDTYGRQDRDIMTEWGRTSQFPDASRAVPGFESVAPRHSAKNDDTLFPMSVRKRLVFANRDKNQRDLASKAHLSRALFRAFHRLGGTDPYAVYKFDPYRYTMCIAENDQAKLSKGTLALLQANAHKSDPDWRFTFVRIFIKSQHKISSTTLGTGVKAGQTLAQFNDRVVLQYGPMVRYLSELDSRYRPAHHYYHAGRTPIDLDGWCREHLKGGDLKQRITNDYTSFDRSQTGEVLGFEKMRLEQASIPQWLIDSYVSDKLSLRCQLGHLATFRFSGEAATWKFNTDMNYAMIGLMYEMPKGMALMVSGDDSLIDGVPKLRAEYKSLAKHFTLLAKTEVRRQSLFCSYICGSSGCVKDPEPLAIKLAIARDRGEVAETWPSLLAEHAPTYQKAELLVHLLDERQLTAVAYINRVGVTQNTRIFNIRMAMGTWRNGVWKLVEKAQALCDVKDPATIMFHRVELSAIYRLHTRSDQLRVLTTLRALQVPGLF